MNTVEFHDITKKRKNFVLEDLNIQIPSGYITGFMGPNGSGKTSTIQLMMGIIQPDRGHIRIFDEGHQDPKVKQKIGFVYDDLYMYEDFNIRHMKAFIAPLYQSWNEEVFQKYLRFFDLPEKKKIKHFSMGMKMKCSLLFALSHEPELIIMDEPTSGLDPIVRRELINLFQQLMIHEKQTIFLATHLTTDLDKIADYIIFIHEGKILFQKSMEEIRDEYYLVKGKADLLDADTRKLFAGIEENDQGFSALFIGDPTFFNDFTDALVIEQACLEDIMYFLTR